MNFNLRNVLVPYSIIFVYKKGSILHKAIWWFSKRKNEKKLKYLKKTAHVLLYLKNGETAEVNAKGLIIRGLKRYKKSRYSVQIGVVKGSFDGRVIRIFAERAAGKVKYDYTRIGILVIQKLFGLMKTVGDYTENAMICTEWCVEAFMAVGIKLMPGRSACSVTPLDLLQSNKLKIIIL